MPTTVAILLSCYSFESFFGDVLSLSVEEYLRGYRNDYSWTFMEMFRNAGLNPILYIPAFGASGLRTTEDGYSVRFLPVSGPARTICGLPIWKGRPGRYISGIVNAWGFLSPLKDAIKSDRVDVLYEQEYWHARFDLLAWKFSNDVVFVASDHGANERYSLTLFKRSSIARAAVLTSQSAEEASVVEQYGVRPQVMPNPVDTDYYSPSPAKVLNHSAVKTVLTVARLTERQKRTSDLIEAMRHLDPTWRLKIAGDGPDRAMLEERVRSLDLSDRVEFLGFVRSKEVVRELYRTSDVFCLPSSHEGLAMVALEAMSTGLPVVLTPAPAFKALIRDGESGILTPVADPLRLAESIKSAYTHREKLSANGRETILKGYSRAWFMDSFTRHILARVKPTPGRGVSAVVPSQASSNSHS